MAVGGSTIVSPAGKSSTPIFDGDDRQNWEEEEEDDAADENHPRRPSSAARARAKQMLRFGGSATKVV